MSFFSEFTLINLKYKILLGALSYHIQCTCILHRTFDWSSLLLTNDCSTVTLFYTRSARSSLRDKWGNLAGQVRPVRPSVYRGWRGLWAILCWWPSPGWRRQLNALFRSINPHGCSSCRDVPSSSSQPYFMLAHSLCYIDCAKYSPFYLLESRSTIVYGNVGTEIGRVAITWCVYSVVRWSSLLQIWKVNLFVLSLN